MEKKSQDKPLTERRLVEILPGILEKSFDRSFNRAFPPAFKKAFKPAFDSAFKEAFKPAFDNAFTHAFKPAFHGAFEPYALAIQQDFKDVKEKMTNMEEDIVDLKDGQQRVEQRQLAEIKRKDFLSVKIDNHEKRIINLEKTPTR